MRPWVQKFGGTSVGSPERILHVAKRIARVHASGRPLVVVVSAMGDTTDDLIELAHQISQSPPHREMDMLLTAGERISMALLSMALHDLRVSAISLTGSQSGIITDSAHRAARIQRILGERIRQALDAGKVAIVAGFQGVSEGKEITTLGRGGSDTTAVALAAALEAEVCEIFTDVDGIFSADPRMVSRARFWPEIPGDLMVELATRGAGVLHPRSVELARQYGVTLRVRNSMNESEGTEVAKAGKKPGMEEFDVAGVTCDRGKFLARVELARPTVLSAIWSAAAEHHLKILAPQFSESKVWFFADRDREVDWQRELSRLSQEGFVREYHLDPSLVPVSVVGNRFSQDGAALQEIIESLAQSGISVTIGTASALAMTVAVPGPRAEEAVQLLHRNYLEGGVTSS